MTLSMMPVEWPLAASAADHQVDPARQRAGGNRLPVAMADFFLDEGSRLTDEERSLMAAMLRGLVNDIADELIMGLPPIAAAKAEVLRDGLYRKLREAGLLAREGLVSLLLRRADEQQLAGHAGRPGDAIVAPLVGDEDAAVAEAAMALALSRGRRRDRFGRLGAEFDDLAAEDAVALVHAVAAALAKGLNEDSDQPVAVAAQRLLARHDEGLRLEAQVAALARALEASGRAGDEMVRSCAEAGDPALLVALLARRAGVEQSDAWRLFTGGDAMMIARLAGCDRSTAAQILAAFEPMSGSGAAERIIERFDLIDDAFVEQCRQWLRLDPSYRLAREALDGTGG